MKSKRIAGTVLAPVLLALPFAAAMGFAAFRYGNLLRNLIHTAIKLVVTK